MGARLEAAKAATDEVMRLAAEALAAAGDQERFMPLFEQVVTKARAARAALEAVLESDEGLPPDPEGDVDFGDAQRHQPGGPVAFRTEAPKPRAKERGGPRDGDQGPGVFKAAGVGPVGASQIQRDMRTHCELCGLLLDMPRQDPCPMPDCPYPHPAKPRAA